MKIIFNLVGTGLANNGGSKTLIQSANTLHELGHEIVIVDNGKNYNTWNPIKCKHLIIKKPSYLYSMDGDVIIGTGTKSIEHTNISKIKNKFLWIRGFETWNVPEDKLIKILKDSKTKKIVNSICLKNKLEKYGILSEIIRPGHNFNELYPLDIRKDNKKVILGGLYNEGKKRSKKRTNWIFDCYNILKNKYDIELWMFGSDGIPYLPITKYYKNPDSILKNKIYNRIDIWLSPSELEGLHIAPAEAMLTECCVVGNDSELNGTKDYLIDTETGLESENNFNSFLANVEILINHKTMRHNYGKNGRNKIISLGDRKKNMLKLISLLKESMK